MLLLFSASFVLAKGRPVIFPFENDSGDAKVEWLGYGVELLFEDSLNAIPLAERMDAVDNMDVPDSGSLTLATRLVIARKLGAAELITGKFAVSDGKITIKYTRYQIDKLTEDKSSCTVSMDGFPANLSVFIQTKVRGKYPYPLSFTGHQFEVYARGMLRSAVNGDFKEIEKLAKQVEDCEPLNRNLGNLLFDTGHFGKALEYLKRLPKSDIRGLFRSGMCCVQLENYSDGLIYFLHTLKFSRDMSSVVNAAGCLLALNHPEEAATFLQSLQEKGEGVDPLLLYDRSVVAAAMEQWVPALNILSRYTSSFRFTDEAKQLAALCCGRCDCNHPLCADNQPAVGISEKQPDVLSLYQFSEGESRGNEALDLKDIKELYLAKAAESLKNGSKKEAVDALQKVLYLDPLQKDALKMLCEHCQDKDACKKLAKLAPHRTAPDVRR